MLHCVDHHIFLGLVLLPEVIESTFSYERDTDFIFYTNANCDFYTLL